MLVSDDVIISVDSSRSCLINVDWIVTLIRQDRDKLYYKYGFLRSFTFSIKKGGKKNTLAKNKYRR